ncbi:MAG: nucleotidyltransferase family protein [Eubacterium sp.]|nr:nucleotidyltransferase family protein [Eubacterium sp.]
MKSCCIIIAAGLSSRMKNFKPLLPIHNQPAIVHLVHSMQKAGVDHVIIVTGHRSDELITACFSLDHVSFVHNPNYASSGMIESAKIGFSKVLKEYSRILFTPADIPLIPSSIIKELLHSEAPLIYPSYQFKKGHPVVFDACYLKSLIAYNGDCGLRGAFAALNISPSYLTTDDPRILMDMDTPDDYQKLLETEESICNQN